MYFWIAERLVYPVENNIHDFTSFCFACWLLQFHICIYFPCCAHSRTIFYFSKGELLSVHGKHGFSVLIDLVCAHCFQMKMCRRSVTVDVVIVS